MPATEEEPLLLPKVSPEHPSLLEEQHLHGDQANRSIDSDILPETAITGRRIGWGSAYILVISRVIGSGIFAMPGTVLQNVGSPGLAIVLWVIGALVAWASLVIDIEYGCMLPRSGGMKVYLEYTYRRPRFLASTMIAVEAVLLGFTASNCIIFAKYTMFAIGIEVSDFRTKMLAVGLLTAITLTHGCFYKGGILVQNILGWVKVALVIFMICTGMFVIIFQDGNQSFSPTQMSTTKFWPDLWVGSDWAWSHISTAFLQVFYSYAGLNNLNNVLNEVKHPVKTVKTVGPAALLTACIMYVLVNIAYLVVVPLQEVKESRELIAALFFQRLFGSGFGEVFLPLAVAVSAAGNVMVVTFSLARLNQEIARQGFLPYAKLLASSQPFGAPTGGLLVHYVPSVLVIALPPSGIVYAFIANVEGYAGQYFALALAIGLLLLRVRKPDLHRPFKAWLPVVYLRVALCLTLIVAPVFPPQTALVDGGFFYAAHALVALAVLAFGILYWYVWVILLPQYRGYRLEDEPDILGDGTTITKLVRRDL